MAEATDSTQRKLTEFEQRAADARRLFESEFRAGTPLEKAEAATLQFYKLSEPCPISETGEWSENDADQRRLLDYARALENLRRWCAQWKWNLPIDAFVDRANAPGGIGELGLEAVALNALMHNRLASVAEVRDCPDEILSRMIAGVPGNRGEETLAEIRDAANRWAAKHGSPADDLAVAHAESHSVDAGDSGPVARGAAAAPAAGNATITESGDTIEGFGSAPTPIDRVGLYQDWLVRHPKRGAQAELCKNLGIYPGDLRKWRKRQKFKDNGDFSLKIVVGLRN
jgi:hypothetical protein